MQGPLHGRQLPAKRQVGGIFQIEPPEDPNEDWDAWYSWLLLWPPDARGNRIVPTRYITPDGRMLGWWLHKQRLAKKKGLLQPAHVKKLRSDGGVIWDAQEAAWEEGFAEFSALPRNEHGQRMVPQSYVSADGYRLGAWLTAQRSNYKKNKQWLLRADRVERLEAAGIVWDINEAAWEEALARFRALPIDADGRRSVTSNFVSVDGFRLGQWQLRQRSLFARELMSDAHVAKLNGAGFVWGVFDSGWEDGFAHFEAITPDERGNREVAQKRSKPCETYHRHASVLSHTKS